MNINEEELLAIKRMLDDAVLVVEVVRGCWYDIQWNPTDETNSAFLTTITAFQREQINQLFEYLLGNSTT